MPSQSHITRIFVVLAIQVLLSAGATAQGHLNQVIEADFPYLIDLYRYFHQNPELHDQESKTGARMASEMRTAGFDVHEPIGGHGHVGVLKNGEGPVLLLRTVMDALPIEEETGLPYASTTTALGTDSKEGESVFFLLHT